MLAWLIDLFLGTRTQTAISRATSSPKAKADEKDEEEMSAGEIEARKLFHLATVEEYKALRAEINVILIEYKKVFNISLASVPFLYTAINSVNDPSQKACYFFIASCFYGMLTLYILRHMWHVISLGDCSAFYVAVKARENLNALAGKHIPLFDEVYMMESDLRQRSYQGGPLYTVLEMSSLFIPMATAFGVWLCGVGVSIQYYFDIVAKYPGQALAIDGLCLFFGLVPFFGFIFTGIVAIKMRKRASYIKEDEEKLAEDKIKYNRAKL